MQIDVNYLTCIHNISHYLLLFVHGGVVNECHGNKILDIHVDYNNRILA